jgi:hypothetical protein
MVQIHDAQLESIVPKSNDDKTCNIWLAGGESHRDIRFKCNFYLRKGKKCVLTIVIYCRTLNHLSKTVLFPDKTVIIFSEDTNLCRFQDFHLSIWYDKDNLVFDSTVAMNGINPTG